MWMFLFNLLVGAKKKTWYFTAGLHRFELFIFDVLIIFVCCFLVWCRLAWSGRPYWWLAGGGRLRCRSTGFSVVFFLHVNSCAWYEWKCVVWMRGTRVEERKCEDTSTRTKKVKKRNPQEEGWPAYCAWACITNLFFFCFVCVAGRRGLGAFQRTRPHPDKNIHIWV